MPCMRRYLVAGLIGLVTVVLGSGGLAVATQATAGNHTSVVQTSDAPPDAARYMPGAATANSAAAEMVTLVETKLSNGISRDQAIAIAWGQFTERGGVRLRSAVAAPLTWFAAGSSPDGLSPNEPVWGVTFDGNFVAPCPAPAGCAPFRATTVLLNYRSGDILFFILCNPPLAAESC